MTFDQEYGRYCLIGTADNSVEVVFFNNGVAVARRSFAGCNGEYIDSAIDNWQSGILKSEHFTLEERLRA
jgi:hypothetical protein